VKTEEEKNIEKE